MVRQSEAVHSISPAGVMDYYRMKNVQADTAMREAIGGTGGESPAGDKTPDTGRR